jgi:hypothetical protein
VMARSKRLTFRLDEKELAALNGFADDRHVLPSEALRMLIEVGATLTQARAGQITAERRN